MAFRNVKCPILDIPGVLKKKLCFFIFRFMKSLIDHGDYLAYIIPTIKQRLTSDDESEPTEEIRLLLVQTLQTIIDLNGEKCGVFIDDYVTMLKKTIVDSFADVRKVRIEY